MTYKIKETKQGYVYYTGIVLLDSISLDFEFRIREESASSESFVYAWSKSEALKIISKSMVVKENTDEGI